MAEPVRIVRRRVALWRHCLDGVLVLAPGAEEPVFLTAPGDVIWDLLEFPMTVKQLSLALHDRFTDPTAEMSTDLEVFVTALRARDLVDVLSAE